MTWSQNPYRTGQTAGTNVVPGHHPLTILESLLTHPTHTDGFVDKGDPVKCGQIYGVAETGADAATDYIAIDIEGIWNLTVTFDSAVAVGTQLYITSAGLITDAASGNTKFGIALGALTETGVIAVKIGNISSQ